MTKNSIFINSKTKNSIFIALAAIKEEKLYLNYRIDNCLEEDRQFLELRLQTLNTTESILRRYLFNNFV
jgi:hypothetical protein